MLPMVELTIFALGILLIDLMVPREWKWINAVGAFIGVLFATLCVWEIQSKMPRGASGSYNSLLVDRFAIYFWYLFLAGAAIAILMSVHYLELEDEHHGEYYSLLLLSVVGMMCMAAGIDIVLLFIGLELMAISTYVLVGFLRRDRRSNEAGDHSTRGLGAESTQPGGGDRTVDDHGGIAVQDRRRSLSSMGAGCLRRRAHQHYRIHVGGGESGGVGAVAADTVSPMAVALGLHAGDCDRLHRDHDGRQFCGAYAD